MQRAQGPGSGAREREGRLPAAGSGSTRTRWFPKRRAPTPPPAASSVRPRAAPGSQAPANGSGRPVSSPPLPAPPRPEPAIPGLQPTRRRSRTRAEQGARWEPHPRRQRHLDLSGWESRRWGVASQSGRGRPRPLPRHYLGQLAKDYSTASPAQARPSAHNRVNQGANPPDP